MRDVALRGHAGIVADSLESVEGGRSGECHVGDRSFLEEIVQTCQKACLPAIVRSDDADNARTSGPENGGGLQCVQRHARIES
jgi:hypothetical protein